MNFEVSLAAFIPNTLRNSAISYTNTDSENPDCDKFRQGLSKMPSTKGGGGGEWGGTTHSRIDLGHPFNLKVEPDYRQFRHQDLTEPVIN